MQVGYIFAQPLGDLHPGRPSVWGPGTDAEVRCTRSRAHGLEEKPCGDGSFAPSCHPSELEDG